MELNDEKVQKITDLLKKIINIHDQNGGYAQLLTSVSNYATEIRNILNPIWYVWISYDKNCWFLLMTSNEREYIDSILEKLNSHAAYKFVEVNQKENFNG